MASAIQNCTRTPFTYIRVLYSGREGFYLCGHLSTVNESIFQQQQQQQSNKYIYNNFKDFPKLFLLFLWVIKILKEFFFFSIHIYIFIYISANK